MPLKSAGIGHAGASRSPNGWFAAVYLTYISLIPETGRSGVQGLPSNLPIRWVPGTHLTYVSLIHEASTGGVPGATNPLNPSQLSHIRLT